ncbi:hypothetical protein [Nonomuraea rosea]
MGRIVRRAQRRSAALQSAAEGTGLGIQPLGGLICDNPCVRVLLKSALAGSAVAVSLLLLFRYWPAYDSDGELYLVSALLLAPFPLSLLAALLARLPGWPIVGLVAPFAMLAIFLAQPTYDAWLTNERLARYIPVVVPIVAGFMLTAMLSALLVGRIYKSVARG